jgi:hypothetical protein
MWDVPIRIATRLAARQVNSRARRAAALETVDD